MSIPFASNRARRNSGDGPSVSAFNPGSLLTSAIAGPVNQFKTQVLDQFHTYASQSAKKNARSQVESDKKLKILACYIVFLLLYSITAMQNRNNAQLSPYTIYDMQKRVGETISGRDGTPGNTSLTEVTTVKDIYSFLTSTFHNSIYTAATFDGDPRFVGGGRPGFMNGQFMILGGIRISQGRSNK